MVPKIWEVVTYWRAGGRTSRKQYALPRNKIEGCKWCRPCSDAALYSVCLGLSVPILKVSTHTRMIHCRCYGVFQFPFRRYGRIYEWEHWSDTSVYTSENIEVIRAYIRVRTLKWYERIYEWEHWSDTSVYTSENIECCFTGSIHFSTSFRKSFFPLSFTQKTNLRWFLMIKYETFCCNDLWVNSVLLCTIKYFSSPELKAQDELLWSLAVRRPSVVCPPFERLLHWNP